MIFKYKRYIFDKTRKMEQPIFDSTLRDEPYPDNHIEPGFNNDTTDRQSKRNRATKLSSKTTVLEDTKVQQIVEAVTETCELSDSTKLVRVGKVESLKVTEDGESIAIVSGLFKMEENIKQFVSHSVFSAGNIIGEIQGPFGKLGKCKIRIKPNISALVDSVVELHSDI